MAEPASVAADGSTGVYLESDATPAASGAPISTPTSMAAANVRMRIALPNRLRRRSTPQRSACRNQTVPAIRPFANCRDTPVKRSGLSPAAKVWLYSSRTRHRKMSRSHHRGVGEDRKSVGEGKGGSVRGDLGGGRIMKKKK